MFKEDFELGIPTEDDYMNISRDPNAQAMRSAWNATRKLPS